MRRPLANTPLARKLDPGNPMDILLTTRKKLQWRDRDMLTRYVGYNAEKHEGWAHTSVGASVTGSQLNRFNSSSDAYRKYQPQVGGSLWKLGVSVGSSRTAGTLTVVVTIDGVDTEMTFVVDADTPDGGVTELSPGLVTYDQFAKIGLEVTTDGSWAPTTTLQCVLWTIPD